MNALSRKIVSTQFPDSDSGGDSLPIIHTPTLWLSVDKPLSGAQNMERDGALFTYLETQYLAAKTSPPSKLPPGLLPESRTLAEDREAIKSQTKVFVRVYQWKNRTITLGRNQHSKEKLLEEDADNPIDVVRRMTGGRAVLHEQELTYSLVASNQHPRVGGSIRESYVAISQILMDFLQSVTISGKIAANFVDVKRPRFQSSASCYDSAGWAEVTMDGQKLIGSAQKRGKHVFLEHGSIPIYQASLPLEHWVKPAFRPKDPVKHAVLSPFLKPPVSLTKLSDTLGRCFLKHLG